MRPWVAALCDSWFGAKHLAELVYAHYSAVKKQLGRHRSRPHQSMPSCSAFCRLVKKCCLMFLCMSGMLYSMVSVCMCVCVCWGWELRPGAVRRQGAIGGETGAGWGWGLACAGAGSWELEEQPLLNEWTKARGPAKTKGLHTSPFSHRGPLHILMQRGRLNIPQVLISLLTRLAHRHGKPWQMKLVL